MKKGVQMFTVRDYMNDARQVEETLNKISAIGYDSIQAATPSFMSHADFKRLMDDAGLSTYSANGDFETMLNDPAALAEAVEHAHAYGVSYIAIGTLPENMRESKEGFTQFASDANKLCAELKKENMKLLYHPHALEFISLGGGLTGMDIIFAETDPEGFHFSLDTHWLASGGVNIVDWIKKVKGRMSLIHFKDYGIAAGANSVEAVRKIFAEVGEGNLDWPAIISACKETGVEAAAVEQDICPGNPFDSLRVSFENMVKLNV